MSLGMIKQVHVSSEAIGAVSETNKHLIKNGTCIPGFFCNQFLPMKWNENDCFS